jgi:hypothetical protein
MTRRYFYMIMVACGLCALTSCVDYSDAASETSARIQLLLPEDFTGTATLEGHEVILQQGSTRLSATTDANGVAIFNGIIPDVYDLSCSWELTEAEYHQATGSNQSVSGCTVSGSKNSLLIKEEQTINLATQFSINQDIIISKIYYAGSKDNNNRNYMAGKYIEIYNQSNKDIDVSGFYIGLVEAESTQAYTLDNLHEVYEDSVVLLKQIFRIPVTTNHKVAAGGTVLIVNSAIDHTANNTSMENDLSGADFEAKDYSSNPVQNNPATPALGLIYTMYPSISNMNLVQSGPCSVVIFRTDEDPASLPTTYPYGKTSGNQWKLLPKRMILDAVEVLPNKTTGIDVKTKRLYDDLDAGYTYINSTSGRNGEVVYRKTSKKTADGRIILMDTNNSSNDFQVSSTIKPREYDDEE